MTDVPGLLSSKIDPERVRSLLEDAGWVVVGRRSGVYYRLRPAEGSEEAAVVVPTDRTAPDFAVLMEGALQQIRTVHPDLWNRHLSVRLTTSPSDAFRFRKESDLPSGLISWNEGEELIRAARATLLAGAKSFVQPARQFHNRAGRFAHRYLDTVLMGQTAPGSYVVTAFAPVASKVPMRASKQPTLEYHGVDVATGRDVTQAVVNALEATVEAIQHYKNTKSLSGFDQRVARGVSYEMAVAIRDVAIDAETAEITVDWDETASATKRTSDQFKLVRADVPILQTAANTLATSTAKQFHVVSGRVHLLTRKLEAGPGVVGLDDGKRKFRVRLRTAEEYHRAVLAHDEGLQIEVAGELSREGNINWLYGARLNRVIRPAPPALVEGRDEGLFEDDGL